MLATTSRPSKPRSTLPGSFRDALSRWNERPRTRDAGGSVMRRRNAAAYLDGPRMRAAAVRLCRARRRFRRALLTNDPVLRDVVAMLREVEAGTRPLVRVLDVAPADSGRRARLRRLLTAHLATLDALLEANQVALVAYRGQRRDHAERRAIRRQISGRRRRAARLIEELAVREPCLREPFRRMLAVARRAARFQAAWAAADDDASRDAARRALRALASGAGESPARLRRHIATLRAAEAEYRAAKYAVCEFHMRLPAWLARRVYSGDSAEDLTQEGILALLHAAERYDVKRGARFITYATYWVCQAMQRAHEREYQAVRVPLHRIDESRELERLIDRLRQELGGEPSLADIAEAARLPLDEADERMRTLSQFTERISLDDAGERRHIVELKRLVSPPASQPLEDQEECDKLQLRLRRILATIDPQLREIVARRFGLADGRRQTLAEIGKNYGLSRERVRQLENKALCKLKHAFGAMELPHAMPEKRKPAPTENPPAAVVKRLAQFYDRAGYLRWPDGQRLDKDGPQVYKKGAELRLVADSKPELAEIRRLLKAAGFKLARPFSKGRQYRQPLYGAEQVIRFLRLIDG